MAQRLACLIDSNAYIFRSFFGMPPMHAPDGTPVQATYGFARTILKLIREQEPDCIAAVFESGVSFRNELYPDYKANRDEPPDDLIPQFESSRRVAAAMGLACIEQDGFEADDVIGTLSVRLKEAGMQVVLVSSDKDLAQLVTDGVTLLDIAKDRELDEAGVHEVFGVRPDQIIDYLALVGDSVDNIPGVQGVGPKTARVLLESADTLDSLIADPAQIADMTLRGRQSVERKIAGATSQLELSRELATIRLDVPLDLKPDELLYHGARRRDVEREFEELGFGGRIRSEITRWAAEPTATGRLEL